MTTHSPESDTEAAEIFVHDFGYGDSNLGVFSWKVVTRRGGHLRLIWKDYEWDGTTTHTETVDMYIVRRYALIKQNPELANE